MIYAALLNQAGKELEVLGRRPLVPGQERLEWQYGDIGADLPRQLVTAVALFHEAQGGERRQVSNFTRGPTALFPGDTIVVQVNKAWTKLTLRK